MGWKNGHPNQPMTPEQEESTNRAMARDARRRGEDEMAEEFDRRADEARR